MGQGQLQGGLLWSYLGQGAVVGPHDLENSLRHPAFMEYTSQVFGDVSVVVRDCPSWVRGGCLGPDGRVAQVDGWMDKGIDGWIRRSDNQTD